ncbi:hypothetical protein SK128_023185, partial [Halocaridina rubra]
VATTDYYDDYDKDKTSHYAGESHYEGGYDHRPIFTATSQDFTVQVKDHITFPCDGENLGNTILMFRHLLPRGGHRLLYVGDTMLKPRLYSLKKLGNSFILSNVSKDHAGKYECRIETQRVEQLLHTLNVQYPATVKRISKEEQRVAKGSTVTLTCEAEGNPKAAISWSKLQGHLPSGAKSEEGFSLILDKVDRHAEGTYICTASNGVGPPSSTRMSVQVEYAPEIITDQVSK